jgi:hypothetical protein
VFALKYESEASEEGLQVAEGWAAEGWFSATEKKTTQELWDSARRGPEDGSIVTAGKIFYLARTLGGWVDPGKQYDIDLSLLDLATWLERDIPPPDFLLGELLSTTTRALLIGPTGLGKTNFSMAKGFAIATGADFLHWKGSGKPHRVLIIDDEMSRRLMQQRLRDLVRRNSGVRPGTFKVLCKEDFEEMPPLNTKDGQRYVDQVIEKLGGVDLVILDNIQALNIGDMNDPASWEPVLPWMRDLTRREIGQEWIHHPGHNETHGYGTSTREWQLDTVMLMARIEQSADADIASIRRTPPTLILSSGPSPQPNNLAGPPKGHCPSTAHTV